MKKLFAALAGMVLLFCAAVSVSASENTTYTYTLSVNGDWIRTQDAYMPGRISLKNARLSAPDDIFVKGRYMDISDSGNSRIAVYNLDTSEVSYIENGEFSEPNGIFVSDDGTVYVADTKANAVFVLKNGAVVKKIEKPESNLFAKGAEFEPKNVVATTQGNIFVCGVGASEGIMKFGPDGEFQGYFAANANTLTLKERLQDMFYSKEQKEAAVARTARPIENIDIADNDLVYSVTQSASFSTSGKAVTGNSTNAVKLHNMAGNNILSKNKRMTDENNFVDVASAPQGRSYALTYTGIINEYDRDGNLIFSFGGRGISFDRVGVFTMAAAIETDDDGIIYVLDKERGIVQSFIPTEFAYTTHRAISEIQNGNYEKSGDIWKDLIRMNAMSKIAHLGYGKSLYHTGHFQDALEEFKTAGDTDYYSDCFWEIRDLWLKENMSIILAAAIIVLALKFFGVGGFIKKKFSVYKKAKKQSAFKTEFKNLFVVMRHPIDSVFELKTGRMGSILSATLIYAAALAVYVADMVFRGFIFRIADTQKTTPLIIIAAFVIPFALWIAGSAMIGSVNSGEGKLKYIYIVNAYALLPYVFGAFIIILLSHVLTGNEAFIINFGWTAVLIWTALDIFAVNRELQNYGFSESVKNTFLTFFFMIMTIVAIAILVILGSQLTSFLNTLFNEVVYRVGK